MFRNVGRCVNFRGGYLYRNSTGATAIYSNIYFKAYVDFRGTEEGIYTIFRIGSTNYFRVEYSSYSSSGYTLSATLHSSAPLSEDFVVAINLDESLRNGPIAIMVGYDSSYLYMNVNGCYLGKISASGVFNLNDRVLIGADLDNSGIPTNFWVGKIDEVVFHNSFTAGDNYYELFAPADASEYLHVWKLDGDYNDSGTSTNKFDLTAQPIVEFDTGLALQPYSVVRGQITSSGISDKKGYDYLLAIEKNTSFVWSVRHPSDYGVGVRIWKIYPENIRVSLLPEEWFFESGIWILDKVFTEVGVYHVEFYTNFEGVISKVYLEVVDEIG